MRLAPCSRHFAIALLALAIVASMASTLWMASNGIEHPVDEVHHASIMGNVSASFSAYPPVLVQGKSVRLDASSSQSSVAITNFTWTFSDYGPKTLYGVRTNYTFMHPGNFTITLHVTDADLNTSTNHTTVNVLADTTKPVIFLLNRTIAPGGPRTFTLDASRCTDDGRIVNYTWYLPDEGVFLYGVKVNHTFNHTGRHTISLNVTDAGGNFAVGSMFVDIQRTPTVFEMHWLFFFIELPIIVVAAYALAAKLRRDRKLVTPTDVEKLRMAAKNGMSVWRRFSKSLGGMIGLTILVIFVLMAVLAPVIAGKYHTEALPANAPKWGEVNPSYASPQLSYPFGTDYYGRDVYTLTVWGSRASLEVGFLASFISIVLGTLVGLSAGYFGKISDEALMRVTDFFLVIPWFPLMIVFASLLGRSFTNIIIVIGIVSWPSTARIVRSSVLSLKEKTFVERAVAVGSGPRRIIWRHILPNVFPLIFANTILLVANSIFSESFLDFFGLGPTNVISWGLVLEWAYEYGAFSSFAWWNIFFPGLCIILLIMAFYLIGDALDEVLNPKLRKR